MELETGETAEVLIVGRERRAVLDRERGEERVGDERTARARDLEERPQDPPVARSRLELHHHRPGQPGIDDARRLGDRVGSREDHPMRRQAQERAERRPRERERLRPRSRSSSHVRAADPPDGWLTNVLWSVTIDLPSE